MLRSIITPKETERFLFPYKDFSIYFHCLHQWSIIAYHTKMIVILFLSFRGNYIQCFTPKYFTGAQEKYSEQLCWLESTHYILEPQNEDVSNVKIKPMNESYVICNLIILVVCFFRASLNHKLLNAMYSTLSSINKSYKSSKVHVREKCLTMCFAKWITMRPVLFCSIVSCCNYDFYARLLMTLDLWAFSMRPFTRPQEENLVMLAHTILDREWLYHTIR